MIQKEVDIAPDKQCLTFDGRQLENVNILWNYGLQKDDTINGHASLKAASEP